MVKSGTESLVGKNCLEFLLGALGELFLKFQEVFTAKAKPLAVRRERVDKRAGNFVKKYQGGSKKGERFFGGRTYYKCFRCFHLSREEEPFQRPFAAYFCLICFSV